MNRASLFQRAGQVDLDRTLSTRFASGKQQTGLLLLLLFENELAKISHKVNEPLLARMKLQFWRDALADDHGGGMELARELNRLSGDTVLRGRMLEELIVLHEGFVEDFGTGFARDNTYCTRQAALFRKACALLVPGYEKGRDVFFEQCGSVYGEVKQLLKSRPANPSSVDEEEGRQKQIRHALNNISAELAALPSKARPAVLPIALVMPYLYLYRRANRSPERPVDLHPVRKTWLLWRAIRRGF